jgi:hypothetical protein
VEPSAERLGVSFSAIFDVSARTVHNVENKPGSSGKHQCDWQQCVTTSLCIHPIRFWEETPVRHNADFNLITCGLIIPSDSECLAELLLLRDSCSLLRVSNGLSKASQIATLVSIDENARGRARIPEALRKTSFCLARCSISNGLNGTLHSVPYVKRDTRDDTR